MLAQSIVISASVEMITTTMDDLATVSLHARATHRRRAEAAGLSLYTKQVLEYSPRFRAQSSEK